MNVVTIIIVMVMIVVLVIAIIRVHLVERQERRDNEAYLKALNNLRDEYDRSIRISVEWEKMKKRVN